MIQTAARLHAFHRIPRPRTRIEQASSFPSTLSSSNATAARRTLFTRQTPAQKFKGRLWTGAGLVLGGLFAVYAYDSSAGVHRWLVIPLLHTFTKDDAEASHKFAIKVLASGLSPVDTKPDQEDVLGFDLWGRHFSNPVGLAAGFDKHGEAIDGLFKLGFSYVEIGSVTPHPQDGNPQPRLFRLPSTQSVINRYGFNSEGHIAVLARLRERIHAYITQNALLLPPTTFPEATVSAQPDIDPIEAILQNRTDAEVIDSINIPRSLSKGKVLAINLGKNKLSPAESIDDFVSGVKTLGPYADILVVNVSSPNTPGLRSLQRKEIIQDLLGQVVNARDALQLQKKPVVLLKIAPDLSRQEVADIGEAAQATKIDGIIVSNTTISRPISAGNDPALLEQGGLSGPPLKPLSLRTLKTLYALTSGEIPLIGCGGISTGQDALDYAKAGASFVQLYSALGYQGVGLPRMIKDELVASLKAENKTWQQMVGTGIDLASIKALGRESSPVGLMNLEEDTSNSFDKLRQEIESALSGVQAPEPPMPLTREERLAAFLPDWSDFPSPVTAGQSTTPHANVASSSGAESGMMPDGSPQVIILDKVPEYTPAQPMSKAEFDEKVAEAKHYAQDVKHTLQEGAQHVREGADIAGKAFSELGRDIKQELHVVEDITKDGAKQAGRAFSQVGRDVKEEWHVVEDVTKEGAKIAGRAFREVGRDVKAESKEAAEWTKEVGSDAWQQSKDATRQIGKDMEQDKELAKEWAARAKQFGEGMWAESKYAGRELGKDLEQDKELSKEWAKKAQHFAEGMWAESKYAGREIGKDLEQDKQLSKDFAARARQFADGMWAESKYAGKEIGKDFEQDKELSKEWAKRVQQFAEQTYAESRDATRRIGKDLQHDGQLAKDWAKRGIRVGEEGWAQATYAARQAGHDIKDEARVAGDIGKDAWRQSKEAFREVGHDVSEESRVAGQIGRDAWRQNKEAFREAGRDIREESKDAADIGKEGARQAGSAFSELGRGVKDESRAAGDVLQRGAKQSVSALDEFGKEVKQESRPLAEITKDAFRQAGEAFRELGREIKHDPLLAKAQEGLQGAKKETEYVKERVVREGARGEEERTGGGIWSLFSTVGERKKVGSESKRLV